MSGVAVIRHLLATDQALLAVVPATQIKAGTLPLGTPMPAVAVGAVSSIPRNTVAMTGRQLMTERVQVTALASTYPPVKQILELARKACANRNGTVAGIDLDSILPDVEGPDLDDTETGINQQSRDFIVKWRTAT